MFEGHACSKHPHQKKTSGFGVQADKFLIYRVRNQAEDVLYIVSTVLCPSNLYTPPPY